MAQIQKGTTYSTGDQVTAANLNALADAAILLPGAITDQTAKTVPLAADTILLHSAADTALRKSTLTQLFSNATGIPISTGISGLGTGIATALAINTGTTGAPALLGSAGAFTTLSASGTTTVGPNNTGTGLALLQLLGGSGTNGGASVYFGTNGTAYSSIGQSSGILGGTSTDFLIYANNGGQSIKFYAGGAGGVATISSTGLAVTGTLSSTSDITIGASGNLFLAGNFAKYIRANTGSSADLRLGGWNGVNIEVGSGFTNVASFSSTGLAVTGALSATGAIEGANVIRTNGPATADKAASAAIDYASGFHRAWCWGPNTSTLGQWKIRLVRSDGSAAVEPVSVSSTGLAVTGALSATAGITTSYSGGDVGIRVRDTTDTSDTYFMAFQKANSTIIGSIRRVTTTDAVVFNTTSDGRLKENLRDFTDSGRLIDSLKPRVFDWKNSDENGKNVVGFVAQEEHAADPIFAHIGAVSVGDEDPNTITNQWQRSDSALIPILVAELKSLRQRVAALESK